jgi:Transglutaminase-like superfamily
MVKMEIVRRIRSNFSSFEDIQLFVQVFLFVTILPFLLKLLSIHRLMKVLTPRDLGVYRSPDLERAKEKVIKFTDYILGRNLWVYKSTCLKRSLVLYHFLRRLGINVHICFGVRLPDGGSKKQLEGHAWLLHDRDIFLERNIEVAKTYKMTYCFPEGREKIAQEANLKQS